MPTAAELDACRVVLCRSTGVVPGSYGILVSCPDGTGPLAPVVAVVTPWPAALKRGVAFWVSTVGAHPTALRPHTVDVASRDPGDPRIGLIGFAEVPDGLAVTTGAALRTTVLDPSGEWVRGTRSSRPGLFRAPSPSRIAPAAGAAAAPELEQEDPVGTFPDTPTRSFRICKLWGGCD